MDNFADSLQDNIFRTISNVCSNNNIEAYVSGGYVRDLIIRRPSKDVDIVVVGSGIEAAKRLQTSRFTEEDHHEHQAIFFNPAERGRGIHPAFLLRRRLDQRP